MESFEDKLARVLGESVEIADYDPSWPDVYESELARLKPFFALGQMLRVEHIGSTAVPGLAAKPIVDILVGVEDIERVDLETAPAMEAAGYDYFWRPVIGNSGPAYPWFIGRDRAGRRISHIHVARVDDDEQWDRVVFRDYLRTHPQAARDYAALKRELAARCGHDREAYTVGKSVFIRRALDTARLGPGA